MTAWLATVTPPIKVIDDDLADPVFVRVVIGDVVKDLSHLLHLHGHSVVRLALVALEHFTADLDATDADAMLSVAVSQRVNAQLAAASDSDADPIM
ncbi:hypothetical protein OG563_26655 [Nocardia vinacea]|uniref:Uncharacterized protein n=1 Tax=Nocardia vinacea TaxID=96468 RepID=A0ABZ1YHY9_9NOCA|nr:hypothetical protein [Nocardia vinacea]